MNSNREKLSDQPSTIENVHSSYLSRYQRVAYKLQLRFLFFLSYDEADLQTNGPTKLVLLGRRYTQKQNGIKINFKQKSASSSWGASWLRWPLVLNWVRWFRVLLLKMRFKNVRRDDYIPLRWAKTQSLRGLNLFSTLEEISFSWISC